MTSNQIAYWNYLELVRNNRAKEAETNRANLANETEYARANRANEEIAYYKYLETVRANKASEALTAAANAERERSNRENERISWESAMSSIVLNNANTALREQERLNEEQKYLQIGWNIQEAEANVQLKQAQAKREQTGAILDVVDSVSRIGNTWFDNVVQVKNLGFSW